ncbi:hypothetical protein D9M68_523190 [compost metagenome]
MRRFMRRFLHRFQRRLPSRRHRAAAVQLRPQLGRSGVEFDHRALGVHDHAALAQRVEHAQPGIVADIVQVRAQRAEPHQYRHQRKRGRGQVAAQRAGPAVQVSDMGNQRQGQAAGQDDAAAARQGVVGHFGRQQEIPAQRQQRVRPEGHHDVACAMLEHRAGSDPGRHQRNACPDQVVALVGEDQHHRHHRRQHRQPQPRPRHHVAGAAQVHHRHQPADRHRDDADVLDLGPQDAPWQVGRTDLKQASAAPDHRAEGQHQERLDGGVVAPGPGGYGHADAADDGDGEQQDQWI